MITQKHREYECIKTDRYLIVAKSEKEMNDDLNQIIKEHATDDNAIYVYPLPVRPSKETLRPEYSMEVIIDKIDSKVFMPWWIRVH
jgi:hypothetical protein